MSEEKNIAKLLLDIFGGNEYHAVGKKRSGGAGVWYDLVEEPLTEELLEEHLKGQKVLGSYPILPDNTVKYLGWDIDSAGDLLKARELAKRIIARIEHLPHVVEFSGGKGYHILLFLTEPMPAAKAKEIAEFVRDSEELPRSGDPHVECYPKQAKLGESSSKRRAVGNLLKIPLGQHLTTHEWSRFVNPANGWEDGPAVAPEEVLEWRVTPDEALGLLSASRDLIGELAQAISQDWDEGKRHDLSLYLAGYLSQIGWSFDQTAQLIKRICDLRGDGEVENRLQAAQDTYRKLDNGMRVAGFQALVETLSGAAMRTVLDLAPDLASPDIARRVDKLRFQKGPAWLKERKVADLVWSYLTDRDTNGRILRVPDAANQTYRTYWYNRRNKRVVPLDARLFEVELYQTFQLSAAEGFTQRVLETVRLRAEAMGDTVDVHKSSCYKDGVLYVNFGGPDVWVCNGKDMPYSVHNGELDLFFLTGKRMDPVEPDFGEPIDVWSVLVDDLNFARSGDTPIPPDQQRELFKAWVLSNFFRELLPTRPILTLLGAPGSGKTTGIRRVLQFMEGLQENVLEVVEDKPDFWRSVLENHRMVVLDNLEESNAQWLARSLDQVATGSTIEIRELYKTNRSYQIRADVFVALTAVTMPFSKSTLFERLLTLNMEKLQVYTPAHAFNEQLKRSLNGMWADMLLKLNRVVAELERVKTAPLSVNMRMSDFAMFCARLREVDSDILDGETLRNGLSLLSSSQAIALAQSEHSALPVLQRWIEENPEVAAREHTISDLVGPLTEMAKKMDRKNWRFTTAQSLANHLRAMHSVLQKELGCVIGEEYDSDKGRTKTVYSFPHMRLMGERINGQSKKEDKNGHGG